MPRTAFDDKCIALLAEFPKRHSRHCLRSAFNHLALAEKLTTVDPNMAVFRGITAEEEAASGLMHCLKERGYRNANKLNPRDHVHKSAVVPFLYILGSFFQEAFGSKGVKPVFQIQEQEGIRRLTLGIPLTAYGIETMAYPIPPLNFSVTSEDQRLSYRKQIATYIESTGAKDIVTHIKKQANQRNMVLYAGPDGYQVVSELKPELLAIREARVVSMLRAYLFIQPYRELQPFVQDALDAFLAMLGILENHGLHDEI